jgi:hypothetical protein
MSRRIIISGIRLYHEGLAEILAQQAGISVVGSLGGKGFILV